MVRSGHVSTSGQAHADTLGRRRVLCSRAMPSPTDPAATGQARPQTAPPAPPRLAALSGLFVRAIAALERPLGFETAELVLLEDAGGVRVLTHRGGERGEPAETVSLQRHYSAQLWPEADAAPRFLGDASAGLDPAYEADRRLIESGARSLIVVPLRTATAAPGVLILTGRDPAAFDAAQAPLLLPVCEFLAVAAERERLWAIEQTRHQRRVRLEAMLPMIAESLDVRKVFVELSGVIREVIPHDVLAFALLLPDRSGVRVQAATNQG